MQKKETELKLLFTTVKKLNLMKRSFKELITNLKKTIVDYSYYVDFKKILKNIENYKIELNILNSLIGSKKIEKDFLNIIKKYPKTLKVLPLLLAVRKLEVPIFDKKITVFNFKTKNMSDDDYLKFMKKCGIFNLINSNKIKCLFDYVLGIEVGLDSNARKNRTGKIMEKTVENFIKKTKHIEYYSEMTQENILKKYDVNLNKLSTKQKIMKKKFDFVVKTTNHLYLFEVNFYNSGGSKLNETARSYKLLSDNIKKLEHVSFVWVTDGVGWRSATNNLKETHDKIEHLYTLKDLEEGVLLKIIK